MQIQSSRNLPNMPGPRPVEVDVLRRSLPVAVSAHISSLERLLQSGAFSIDTLLGQALVQARKVSDEAEVRLYSAKGPTHGLQALARALAIQALVAPGGARFLDLTWEAPYRATR